MPPQEQVQAVAEGARRVGAVDPHDAPAQDAVVARAAHVLRLGDVPVGAGAPRQPRGAGRRDYAVGLRLCRWPGAVG